MARVPRQGPNVLLIVFDTARADALEPYGAPVGASPAVAQLAAGGSVASTAFATSSWTVPSHASMFTGLLPRAAGVGHAATPAGHRATMLSLGDRVLPAVLGPQGYATAGVSANLWVSPESGFDTGFDSFHYVRSQRKAEIADRSWKGRAKWALEAVRARADDGASEVERLLAAWLSARDDRPFFWFVNLVECHSPYLPPKPYCSPSILARVRNAADAQNHQTFLAFAKACLPGGFDVDDEALERMRDVYARSVRLMDDWLARILGALDKHGILDETLVVLTSDHGENLGECELMGHTFSLDDRLIRVPMIAAGPGAPSFDAVTSLADVPSLLMDAVGIDEHPYAYRAESTIAVAQLDPPCSPDDPFGYEIIEQLGLGADAHHRMVSPFTCATDGRYKLLRRNDGEILIDLVADPLESGGVPPTPGDPIADQLQRAIAAADATDRAPVPSSPAISGTDADDLTARMELLGYM